MNARRSQLGTAEKKLLSVLIYFFIFATETLIVWTISAKSVPTFYNDLEDYFTCEQDGHDPDNPCSRSRIENLINPFFTVASYVLLELLPLICLLFIFNAADLKSVMAKWHCVKKISNQLNTVINTFH